MIGHITISTIISYIVVRFALPFFIPHTQTIAESGLPEIIAIVIWVASFFKISTEKELSDKWLIKIAKELNLKIGFAKSKNNK